VIAVVTGIAVKLRRVVLVTTTDEVLHCRPHRPALEYVTTIDRCMTTSPIHDDQLTAQLTKVSLCLRSLTLTVTRNRALGYPTNGL